jgi:hypothetical protein
LGHSRQYTLEVEHACIPLGHAAFCKISDSGEVRSIGTFRVNYSSAEVSLNMVYVVVPLRAWPFSFKIRELKTVVSPLLMGPLQVLQFSLHHC